MPRSQGLKVSRSHPLSVSSFCFCLSLHLGPVFATPLSPYLPHFWTHFWTWAHFLKAGRSCVFPYGTKNGPGREANSNFVWRSTRRPQQGSLLGMNEGGDPLGTPGNNFEHDISPGPSPALSGGQEAPQRSTELTEKDISARAIQHGCEDSVLNLKRWAGPVTSKPGLKELRAEVIRRDPTARPSWWGGGQAGGLASAARPQTSCRS